MNPFKYLELAAKVSRLKDDSRTYFHGAVGLRRDGVLVAASNGNPRAPEPKHHCEYRLLRKLGKGGTVFLVRTLQDGTWADTTPCSHCQNALKARGVKKVYFTSSPGVHHCWKVTGRNSTPFPPGPRLAGMAITGLDAWMPKEAHGTLLGLNRSLYSPAHVAKTEPGPSVSPVPRDNDPYVFGIHSSIHASY